MSPLRRLLAAVLLGGCSLSTENSGPVADVRGTWTYAGNQVTPALQFAGTLFITGQSGDQIAGTLSWTEQDGLGNVVVRGGEVTGTVIADSDIDFDVTLADEVRRHIAVITADTLEGIWASSGAAKSGEFRAERQAP
jgi:hypothetical protein